MSVTVRAFDTPSGTVNAQVTSGTAAVMIATGTTDFNVGPVTFSGGIGNIQLGGGGNIVLHQTIASGGGQIDISGKNVLGDQNIDASHATGTAGNITIQGNTVVLNSVTASGGTTGGFGGQGGTIRITTNSSQLMVVNAPITSGNGISGTVVSNGGTSFGNGGTIFLTNNGTGGIYLASGAISAVPVTQGTGGSVYIQTPGNLVTADISVNGKDPTTNPQNGGTIVISARTITGVGTAGATFSAQPVNGGSGGSITVEILGGDLRIDNPSGGSNQFAILTNNTGNGSGGTVALTTSGNMSINPAFFQASPGPGGNGAHLTFVPGGSFSFNGTLVASGGTPAGAAGTIYISIGDAVDPFTIGSASNYGVVGNILANGSGSNGSITIQAPSSVVNNGTIQSSGAISLSAASLTNNGTIQSAGTISLGAASLTNNGTISCNVASTIVGNGSTLSLGGTGTLSGPITISEQQITFLSGFHETNDRGPFTISSPLIIAADSTPTFVAATSGVQISLGTDSSIELKASGATGALNFTGGVQVQVNASNVQIDGGMGLISDSAIVVGQGQNTLTLSGGSAGNPGQINAPSVTFTASNSITFSNGMNWAYTGSGPGTATFQSPQIIVGSPSDLGMPTATFTATGTAINFTPSAGGGGPMSFKVGSASAPTVLNLNGAPVSISAISSTVSMDPTLTLASNNSINITAGDGATLSNLIGQGTSVTPSPILVTNASGALTVQQSSIIATTSGGIELNNLDPNGTITIGKNVQIFADNTSGAGNVQIFLGVTPSAVAGKAPVNVKTVISNGGAVTFGTSSILATAPTNTIVANGQAIHFDTNGAASSHITLGGGDTIVASKAPVLTSLDLTNSSVFNFIKTEQTAKVFGGSLTVLNNQLLGGTLTLSNLNVFPVLSAMNIPQGVTLTLSGFSNSNPINVLLTDPNFNQVQIGGTLKVTGNATVQVAGTVGQFVLLPSGVVTSTGTLNLATLGNMSLQGSISAKTLNLVDAPDLTGNDSLSIAGTVGSTLSKVSISVLGPGGIFTNGAGIITASSLSMATQNGAMFVLTKSPILTLESPSTTGSVFVQNIGNTTLNASNVASFMQLAVIGTLKVAGNISCDSSIYLTSTISLAVNPGVQITTPNGTINLNSGNVAASGKGKITIGSGAQITGHNEVILGLGNPSPALIPGGTPKNVTIVGTQSNVLFGAHGITALATKALPTVTLTAQNGGLLVFSTALAPATAISLGAGSKISVVSNVSTDSAGDDLVVDTDEDADPADAVCQK
jgi:adhesin HecA-like repeat protein